MEYLLSNRTAAEKTDAAAHCASSLSFAMSCIHIMTAIKGNKKVVLFFFPPNLFEATKSWD
jgi:hypothetical protein